MKPEQYILEQEWWKFQWLKEELAIAIADHEFSKYLVEEELK